MRIHWLTLILFSLLTQVAAYGGAEQNFRCTKGVGTSQYVVRFVSLNKDSLGIKNKNGVIQEQIKVQASTDGSVYFGDHKNGKISQSLILDLDSKKLIVRDAHNPSARSYDCTLL